MVRVAGTKRRRSRWVEGGCLFASGRFRELSVPVIAPDPGEELQLFDEPEARKP